MALTDGSADYCGAGKPGLYRKRPVVVEAARWFRVGDVDGVFCINPWQTIELYYDTGLCRHCRAFPHKHGVLRTLEGEMIVCPGDWIVTGVSGERYPVKPAIFHQTYEPVDRGDG